MNTDHMNTDQWSNSYSVQTWLKQGWLDFLATKWISIGFSSIFLLIGIISYSTLLIYEQALIIYPLATGFILVAPVLVTGYQRAARLLHQNIKPQFRDLAFGITDGTPAIWFLVIILLICYLIWLTDALVIYAIYFGIGSVPIDANVLSNFNLDEPLAKFILYSSLLGLGMAMLGFAVSAFSIPLILHQRLSMVTAVYQSVKIVFTHIPLMIRWGLTIAISMLFTLIIALPLIVVVLPVLAYASYAAYHDLTQDIENESR